MGLFGTSGIRRLFDSKLLALAQKVGLVVGTTHHRVAVARDTRTSGSAMKHALISGLISSGTECIDIGVAPLPTLAHAARDFSAACMITASHNPPPYNGIKLINPDGSAFDEAQRGEVEKGVSSTPTSTWDELGSYRSHDGAVEAHIAAILKHFPTPLKLKVVVDCGCGAASLVTPRVLRQMGCEVVAMNCIPSGFFPRPVEPTASNLADLIRAVKECGALLGIAHDGDADRMMAVDSKGRFIPGDKLLVLLARDMAAKSIVTTVDASMAVEELGLTVRRTRVGDVYVSEELKKGGGFGGEPSGSWVFPKFSLCPDGIYAAARIAALAARGGLSEMIDAIPCYPMLRGDVPSEGMDIETSRECLMAMKPVSVTELDGIRLGFDDGWVLVRPSGTEPKIRLTVEARSAERTRALYDSTLNKMRSSVGVEQ